MLLVSKPPSRADEQRRQIAERWIPRAAYAQRKGPVSMAGLADLAGKKKQKTAMIRVATDGHSRLSLTQSDRRIFLKIVYELEQTVRDGGGGGADRPPQSVACTGRISWRTRWWRWRACVRASPKTFEKGGGGSTVKESRRKSPERLVQGEPRDLKASLEKKGEVKGQFQNKTRASVDAMAGAAFSARSLVMAENCALFRFADEDCRGDCS